MRTIADFLSFDWLITLFELIKIIVIIIENRKKIEELFSFSRHESPC